MIFRQATGRRLALVLAAVLSILSRPAHPQPDGAEPLARPDLRLLIPLTARDLARHEGPLALDSVVALPVESAAALAPHRGWLSLGGLDTIEKRVAMELARHAGPLALDGLLVLPPAAAAALAGLRHPLSVGLLALPPETAVALARHRGVLVLSRLGSISPAAARALAAHHGPIAFPRLTKLSYAAALELGRLPHRVSFDVLGGPADEDDPLAPLEAPWISGAVALPEK